MRRLIRLALIALAPLAALLAGTLPAQAHPMGNFSINHYTELTIGSDTVRLLYIVDMAEIPTFQELGSLNAAHSATLTPARRRAYLEAKARSLVAALSLRFNGRPLRLLLRADDLLFPPGAGGLPTERIYLALDAALPPGAGTLSYQDGNFPERAGWKEIVATGAPRLMQSSAPRTSRSGELTVYPTNATSSPPQALAAALIIAPARGVAPLAATSLSPLARIRRAEAPLLGVGGAWSALARRLVAKGPASPSVSWAQGRMDALSGLIARRTLTPTVLLLSLLVAVTLGALHAFSPGHGKTVVAAYIVGSRANAWHAVLLGLTVTVTHTAGVFALGFVTLWLSHYVVPDKLYPWLGALSGLGITVIGASLAVKRMKVLRSSTRRHVLTHIHAHDHGPDHEYHGRAHAHHLDYSHGPDSRYGTDHGHEHADSLSHPAHVPHRHLPDGRIVTVAAVFNHDHAQEGRRYGAAES